MLSCFVIQPFDKGKFDKRYNDVFKPAIESAGLEAYRVDEDVSVVIPIDAIENGIKNAVVCLVDITMDNPNVWYELGFAFASRKPVVIVCSEEERNKKFPFDIQHRSIILYKSESKSDFEKLKEDIAKRIEALLSKQETIEQVMDNEKIQDISGISQQELIVLATIATEINTPWDTIYTHTVKTGVENSGFNALAYNLGVIKLKNRGFINVATEHEWNGSDYQVYSITDDGWAWIDSNEDKLKFKSKNKNTTNEIVDDDIPF